MSLHLTRAGLHARTAWEAKGYCLPCFDVAEVADATTAAPVWLHMGAGNIFRMHPAMLQQRLLDEGLADRGIVVCECYDEAIIPAAYTPYDNLTLAVTLKNDGTVEKRVVASVTESVMPGARLGAILAAPSLQMVSFTITEKGYTAGNALMMCLVDGLYARFQNGRTPLALVSMDNCSGNGDVLKAALLATAQTRNDADSDFIAYLRGLAFPWTMIDKITPRPSPLVAEMLEADGFADTAVTVTPKDTYIAAFVNAEECEYLVIEDDFPNGRPPLERAGVLFTTRDKVAKAEKMKVCTCLNPLHTILGIAGCLLRYTTIAETMRDPMLRALVRRAARESLPVVTDPGVIDPTAFLAEVLEKRFPNPFIPDTPERIAVDTSAKIPVRFGVTLALRRDAGLPDEDLEAIPFFFALWLRYLTGVADDGRPLTLQTDPRLAELLPHVAAYTPGNPDALRPILEDVSIFGTNLYESTLADKTLAYLTQISRPGAVAETLQQFME